MMNTLIELSQSLIRIHSAYPDCNESNIAEFIVEKLSSLSCVLKICDLEPGRPNVIATLKGKYNGPGIGLCAHMDTVPFDSNEWNYPPLEATIHDNKMVGRGACDMKSGLAVFLHVFSDLCSMGSIPDFDVTLILTSSEETFCRGARYLMEHNELPSMKHLFISEPTQNSAYHSHNGLIWLYRNLQGKTGHASVMGSGQNALMDALSEIQTLTKRFPHTQSSETGVRLSVTSFTAGTALNIVPGSSRYGCDIRVYPSRSLDEVVDLVQSIVGPVSLECMIPPLTPTSSLEAITKLLDTLSIPSYLDPLPYVTDASYLSKVSETVTILGPGNPVVAHTVDEYIDIDELVQSYDQYQSILNQLVFTTGA